MKPTATFTAATINGVWTYVNMYANVVDGTEVTISATHNTTLKNALVAAETMEGINSNKVYALPHKAVSDLLKKYNRIK